MKYEEFKKQGEVFLKNLIIEMHEVGFKVEDLKPDHLCFRVSNQLEYDFYKKMLIQNSQLLTEAVVNGRCICTFKLSEDYVVPLIELPAPKNGTPYPLGFEHAEFVISEAFDSFVSRFPLLQFTLPLQKSLNPELCLQLGAYIAKFHHHSLERVIEIENAPLKHLVFDFDGTLINSRRNIYEINRQVFTQALLREVSLDESKVKFHSEFAKLFKAFELDCPVKQQQAIAAWSEISGKFSYDLFDGVASLLERLKSHGYVLHLWTARDEVSARAILTSHQIESIFSTLSFATAIDSKPHTRSLQWDWQSADPHSVMVVGDSPADMIGSQNIRAIGAAAVWDPHAQKNDLIAYGAELIFHDIQELERWLL